jgi:type VI protein secretion system component Hcp
MSRTKFLKATVMAVAVSALAAAPASAGSLYLQDATYFTSDTGLPNYLPTPTTGTIAIRSMTFGASSSSSWSKGGGGASVGKATPDEVTITKAIDANTPVILSKMVSGLNIGQVKIRAFIGLGGAKTENNLTYCFNEVFITSTQQSVGDDGQGAETVRFVFRKMAVGTASQKLSGGLNPFTRGGWDVAANLGSTPSASTECLA